MSGASHLSGPYATRPAGRETSGPVLVVEDDPDIAEGLRYNLERAGISARVALTGEEGLSVSLAPSGPPALIILDLLLPGMTGLELCRRLRRETATRQTPIVVVTACDSPKAGVAVRESGADEYFVKPFSVREVIERVRELLNRAES